MVPQKNRIVAVIGSGGREHALVWKLSQSKRIKQIYAIPGNVGTANLAKNIELDISDLESIVTICKEKNIDLVIIGPDDVLAAGLADKLHEAGVDVFGPTKKAATIESSKVFAKEVMNKANVQTAAYSEFTNLDEAITYCNNQKFPLVVKADGLALGKGVTICNSLNEAKVALKESLQDKVFGDAGTKVIIEEFVTGAEISLHAVSDGENYVMYPSAQDHKPIREGDTGPNTGGMGTIAPLPWLPKENVTELGSEIIKPVLIELKQENREFAGCLYPSVMIGKTANNVIEFNARFGDPEMQSYARLLKTDILDLVEASISGNISQLKLEWEDKFACCIVLASGGYPGKYEKGNEISGVKEAEELPDIVVFHAGTKVVGEKLVTNGGRVLGITAMADTLDEALEKAYSAVKLIHFEGMQYRRDIGKRVVPRWVKK